MPPRARRPAELPTDPNDFAPNGSDRTRQGRPIPERLPPGRRNQTDDKPARQRKNLVDPSALRAAIEAQQEETPTIRPTREQIREQALRERGLLPVVPATEPGGPDDPGVDMLLQPLPRSMEAPTFVEAAYDTPHQYLTSDLLSSLTEVIMLGLKLRLLGDGEQTWEDWDELAQGALLQLAPEDPLESLNPAARFLWGNSGLMRLPETLESAEQIEDIANLGKGES